MFSGVSERAAVSHSEAASPTVGQPVITTGAKRRRYVDDRVDFDTTGRPRKTARVHTNEFTAPVNDRLLPPANPNRYDLRSPVVDVRVAGSTAVQQLDAGRSAFRPYAPPSQTLRLPPTTRPLLALPHATPSLMPPPPPRPPRALAGDGRAAREMEAEVTTPVARHIGPAVINAAISRGLDRILNGSLLLAPPRLHEFIEQSLEAIQSSEPIGNANAVSVKIGILRKVHQVIERSNHDQLGRERMALRDVARTILGENHLKPGQQLALVRLLLASAEAAGMTLEGSDQRALSLVAETTRLRFADAPSVPQPAAELLTTCMNHLLHLATEQPRLLDTNLRGSILRIAVKVTSWPHITDAQQLAVAADIIKSVQKLPDAVATPVLPELVRALAARGAVRRSQPATANQRHLMPGAE